MIEAVIFDMDGIMFDTEQLMLRALEQTAREFAYDGAGEIKKEIMGTNARVMRQIFMRRYGPDFPYDRFMAFRQKLVDREIGENGVPLKPGLFELLRYLRKNGYGTAVATSTSREHALEYIRSTGAEPYFRKIICGDMLEKSKPDPEIYCTAAAALNLAPEVCMALEDSPNGIRSAHAAGMAAVMVPDLIPPSPELDRLLFARVETLSDVIGLLEEQKLLKSGEA
jgi:HAD superfamily hydrolase (TIGR01509 family)